MRLDRPCEKDASDNAGELVRAVPVCALGRDVDKAGVRLAGVTNVVELFDVVLFVRCLEENVEPYKFEGLEPGMGPDTERTDEATESLLELRDCAAAVTDEPDAARRALAGEGGARNLPPGDADSFEKLPFLSMLPRGRGTSKLPRVLGLSARTRCDELLMTEARLLLPELTTLAGRDL